MGAGQGGVFQKRKEMAVQTGVSLGLGKEGFKGEALRAGRDGML